MLVIKAAAIFNFAFGIFHLFFWRLLKWKEQLKHVSAVNRAVMQTLNICLTFIFLLVGYIYFFFSGEVLSTRIGHALLLGMVLFWFIRTIAQIYFFNLKEKVHQILLILFILGVVVHLFPLL